MKLLSIFLFLSLLFLCQNDEINFNDNNNNKTVPLFQLSTELMENSYISNGSIYSEQLIVSLTNSGSFQNEQNITFNLLIDEENSTAIEGIQYCSNVYTDELKRRKINISMTEENHCYENALVERVYGILKDEFYLDQTFASVAEAQWATKNAIKLYNSKRLHLSLNYKIPNNVHQNAA